MSIYRRIGALRIYGASMRNLKVSSIDAFLLTKERKRPHPLAAWAKARTRRDDIQRLLRTPERRLADADASGLAEHVPLLLGAVAEERPQKRRRVLPVAALVAGRRRAEQRSG